MNFSSDWKNGVAIGALINAIAPGLCSDWDTWNDTNYFKNTQESMSLAADWLNIQLYITPEELTNGSVDEKSLLTYLSQFPGAKLRAGAPLRAKYVANRFAFSIICMLFRVKSVSNPILSVVLEFPHMVLESSQSVR